MHGWQSFFMKSLCPPYHQVDTTNNHPSNNIHCFRSHILSVHCGIECDLSPCSQWDDDKSREEHDIVHLELVSSAPVLSACSHGRLEHSHISPMSTLSSSDIPDPTSTHYLPTSSSNATMDQKKAYQYQPRPYLQWNL